LKKNQIEEHTWLVICLGGAMLQIIEIRKKRWITNRRASMITVGVKSKRG